jgi:hypothetical protein
MQINRHSTKWRYTPAMRNQWLRCDCGTILVEMPSYRKRRPTDYDDTEFDAFGCPVAINLWVSSKAQPGPAFQGLANGQRAVDVS